MPAVLTVPGGGCAGAAVVLVTDSVCSTSATGGSDAIENHTSIREATFTLGVGSKGITWVTEWAPLGSLSEGEHTVWAFGQSLSNGVGARPITLLAVIESGDTCRTTQRTVSTVNLHSEVDSELTQLLLLIQIRQKVH